MCMDGMGFGHLALSLNQPKGHIELKTNEQCVDPLIKRSSGVRQRFSDGERQQQDAGGDEGFFGSGFGV